VFSPDITLEIKIYTNVTIPSFYIAPDSFEVTRFDKEGPIAFADVFTDYFITFHFFKELLPGLPTATFEKHRRPW